MAATDYYPLVQQIYIAYFGRPADPGGQAAFARQLDALGAATGIVGLARQLADPANAALRALVGAIGASAESRELYDGSDTAAFVNAVFLNVLDRPARLAGLTFWTGEIDAGRVTREQAALSITAGAFSNATDPVQASLDQATIAKKVAVASHFTALIDTDAELAAFRGDTAAALARAMLEAVGRLTDLDAAYPVAEALLRRLGGARPADEGVPLDNDAAFAGGAGAERVVVGATNRSIDMGGGDDSVVLKAAALGAGSLDGGAGTDTLVMSAADAIAASGNGALAASMSGFERLYLSGVAVGTVDIANLDGIAHITLSGGSRDNLDALLLDNVPSGATVALEGAVGALAVSVKDAAPGRNDVLTVSASHDGGVHMGTISVAGVETVHFVTYNPLALIDSMAHSATLLADDVAAITVTGNGGLSLQSTSTALARFDASGQSGNVDLLTAAFAGSAVIKGGAGVNTIDFSAATGPVEYSGGAARDHVMANAADNAIRTGEGDDEVVLKPGNSSVDLGGGNDRVALLQGGASVIAGGAGLDTFLFEGAGRNSASRYATILDIADGEVLRFFGAEAFAAAGRIGAAADAGAGASFRQHLDAAARGTTGGELRWFVFGGDTYVVNDVSGAAAFTEGADLVVKLAGVLDLSGSSVSADGTLTVSIG